MKNYITIAFLLLSTISTFSQIKFENGYFIDNDGVRTECLIKNMDWRNNPSEFLYILPESNIQKSAYISVVSEFEIFGESKYERKDVRVDISESDLNRLDYERNPKWENRTVFLKVLVEGDINLYQYLLGNNFKYFYSTSENNVEQLIFKEYLTKRGDVTRNLTYVDQLFKNVNCKDLSVNKLKNTKYSQTPLIKYFKENNLCQNPNAETVKNYRRNKGKFNLRITPGVNISSLSMMNGLDNKYKNSYDFDSEINLRIGAEFEYVFPFNKNKWSIFIDPNYYTYSSSIQKELETSFITIKTIINADAIIKRLAIPFGVRHYMFHNDNIKFFVDAGFSYDADLGSMIIFDIREDLELEAPLYNIIVGAGINVKNKYSVEIRYFSPDYLSASYIYWDSKFNTFSFIFGYNFL